MAPGGAAGLPATDPREAGIVPVNLGRPPGTRGRARRTRKLAPPRAPDCGVGWTGDGVIDPAGVLPPPRARPSPRSRLLPGLVVGIDASGNATPFAASHTEQVLARAASLLRPPATTSPRGERLLPKAGGRGCSQLLAPRASRSRAAASFADVVGLVVPRKAGPPGGAPGPRGQAPAPAPLSGAPPPSGLTAREEVASFSSRDQSFTIPFDWYEAWLLDWTHVYRQGRDAAHGKVHSVHQTLDVLWAAFRSESRGDPDVFRKLLGCYNLHRDDWEWEHAYQFWNDGWGAPFRFHVYACQLVLTYVQYANTKDVNPYTNDAFAQCRKFPEFLEAMLEGKSAERHEAYFGDGRRESCSLAIHYSSAQRGYGPVNEPCHSWKLADTCHEGYNPGVCDGKTWDDWDLRWVGSEGCYTGRESGEDCQPPKSGCGGIAFGGSWNVVFPPNQLAYHGLVADRIMHLARLALDYAYALGDEGDLAGAAEYLLTAQRLSRYVLCMLADHGETLIHEIGHVYLGGGHCPHGHHCCFESASNAWKCRVRAHLGIPLYTYERRGSGDFDNPDAAFLDNCASCSTDSGTLRYHALYCDTVVDGTPGQVATVAALPCWSPDTAEALGCGEDA